MDLIRGGGGDIFAAAMTEVGVDRVMFITDKGYLNWKPSRTEVAYTESLIAGAHVPFVLRKGAQAWILVDEAYAHGVMCGEACQGLSFQ